MDDHTAAIAHRIRQLSDEALCALLDCARWTHEEGTLTEIAQSTHSHRAIVDLIHEIER